MSLPCGFWLQAGDTLWWGQREHERGKGNTGVRKEGEGDTLQAVVGLQDEGPSVSVCRRCVFCVCLYCACVLCLSTYVPHVCRSVLCVVCV